MKPQRTSGSHDPDKRRNVEFRIPRRKIPDLHGVSKDLCRDRVEEHIFWGLQHDNESNVRRKRGTTTQSGGNSLNKPPQLEGSIA